MARRRTVELLRVRGDDGDFRGERPQDYDLRYGAGQYERLTIPWSEPLITRMSAAYRCPARSWRRSSPRAGVTSGSRTRSAAMRRSS